MLFALLGTRMMLLGCRLQARSYEEFNQYLFGERWGPMMTALISVMLLGVTSAMMSGTGSLFAEQLGLSFHVGVIFTALLSFFFIVRGMDGVLSVNSLVVPLMFLFIVLVAAHAWQSGDLTSLATLIPEPERSHWLPSAFVYVSFNLVLTQAVLVPLGAEVADERTIKLGGWIGGVGLGIMLFACNLALQLHWQKASQLDIPMGYVISTLGVGVKFLFLAMMWAEIFTSLIGNVYGLTANLSQVMPLKKPLIMVLIFGVAYLFSLIGFPTLVHYLYPLFGYCGLVVLTVMICRRMPAA
ncbi:hypothetical protein [Laceyella putida]|uniref:Membrane protein YkvI n=1 Tax=Laceyella putida TaxID=110101 RepID=A0ABW2RLI3_9BACL